MKKITCAVFFILFKYGWLLAQPSILWEKSYGGSSLEKLYAIKETSDLGYIMTGSTFSSDGDVGANNGGGDCWVVKTQADGTISWKKNYGGENTDIPYDICILKDGGFVFVGLTYSLGLEVQGNHGNADVWVVKIDSLGNLVWQRCLGGANEDVGYGVQETPDGGIIICGETTSIDGDVEAPIGGSDVWLVRLNADGALEWEKSLGGANGNEAAYKIQSVKDGGYVFFGESNSSNGQVTGQHGNDDWWLGKVNNLGELEWQRTLGGSYSDRGWDICPASNGGYFLIGYAGSPDGDVVGWHGNYDYWIVRISNTGDILWQRTLGGYNDDYGYTIFATKDGGCIAAGATMSTDGDVIDNDGFRDIWVVKLDSTGNEIWQKTLGGTSGEFCRSVIETHDGNYIIAGDSYSSDGDVSSNQGSSDFWVVKLSPEISATNTIQAIPLTLSPNPARDLITLHLSLKEPNMQVSITDELGQLLISGLIRSEEDLDISCLKRGVYWLTAVSESGRVYAGKFMKVK